MIKLKRSYFFSNEDWFKNIVIPPKSNWDSLLLSENEEQFWMKIQNDSIQDINNYNQTIQLIKTFTKTMGEACDNIDKARNMFKLITSHFEGESKTNKKISDTLNKCFDEIVEIGTYSYGTAFDSKNCPVLIKSELLVNICKIKMLLDEYGKLNIITNDRLTPSKYLKSMIKIMMTITSEIIELYQLILSQMEKFGKYKGKIEDDDESTDRIYQNVTKYVGSVIDVIKSDCKYYKDLIKDSKKLKPGIRIDNFRNKYCSDTEIRYFKDLMPQDTFSTLPEKK